MMLFSQHADIILASTSPRRSQILKDAGFHFTIQTKNVEEIYPEQLVREQIPLFLAELKAKPLLPYLKNEALIAADTIVWLKNQTLGKPKDVEDAYKILALLSGNTHEVITGVYVYFKGKISQFYNVTEVTFRKLTKTEIENYIQKYQPMDKAGAYGIQDWIGLTTVTKINGCFYNVMGLPMPKLYQELLSLKVFSA